jgi:hypothetical protein
MATITVKGIVSRVFFENKGIEVTEHYKSKSGELKQRKYTAWFERSQQLANGMTGTFTGTLSAVIDEWKNQDGTPKLDNTGKPGKSVKLSINGATFTADDTRQPSEPTSWAQVDDELPF